MPAKGNTRTRSDRPVLQIQTTNLNDSTHFSSSTQPDGNNIPRPQLGSDVEDVWIMRVWHAADDLFRILVLRDIMADTGYLCRSICAQNEHHETTTRLERIRARTVEASAAGQIVLGFVPYADPGDGTHYDGLCARFSNDHHWVRYAVTAFENLVEVLEERNLRFEQSAFIELLRRRVGAQEEGANGSECDARSVKHWYLDRLVQELYLPS